MVPEWREQYLDYRKGKKKIKKLKRRTSVLAAAKAKVTPRSSHRGSPRHRHHQTPRSRHLTQLPAQPSELIRADDTGTPEFKTPFQRVKHSKRRVTFSDVGPSPGTVVKHSPPTPGESAPTSALGGGVTPKSVTSAAVTPGSAASGHVTPSPITPAAVPVAGIADPVNPSPHEFALPSPAIDPCGNSTGENSLGTASENVPSRNDSRTPLLHPELCHRPSTISRFFDSMRRSNSIAQLFGGPKAESPVGSPHGLGGVTGTELDDMAGYAKQQFVAWVDGELQKVDTFYREREQEDLDRFLVLQDQLCQMNDQRQEIRRRWEAIEDGSRTGGIANNGVVGTGTAAWRERRISAAQMMGNELYGEPVSDVRSRKSIASSMSSSVSTHPRLNKLQLVLVKEMEVFSKFELPSLPTFDWLRENGKHEKQYYEDGYGDDSPGGVDSEAEAEAEDESEDSDASIGAVGEPAAYRGQRRRKVTQYDPRFNRRDYARLRPPGPADGSTHKVAYYIARRQLKRAVYEFYRSLELLKSYRLTNRTAFRKLIKKYDKSLNDTLLPGYMKKVDSQYFTTSDVLDNLVTKVEEMFTQYFENGNRKIALTKLREIEQQRTYYVPGFMDGWLLGLALPIFGFTVYYALDLTISGTLPEGKWLMQIWAGFFLLCLMAMLFGINCLVWDKFRVNYRLIFEFNPRDNLNYRQYLVIPIFLFFIGSVLSWFSFKNFWPVDFNGRDWPWIFVAVATLIMFCPFNILYLSARKWLLSTVFRLALSGLYPVEFKDFFLGDIFCSLTYSISNTSMFFCLYGTHWDKCLDGSGKTRCGSSGSRLLGFLQALPNLWRLLQCFRRFADTGDGFPHLANMCKYFISCMYYMALSLYRIETVPSNRTLLIVFGSMNGLVSAAWDIFMDWSLFVFDSRKFHIRDELTYKKKSVYYTAMVLDIILRHQWMCYALFPNHIQQSAITGFGVALAEVIRRFNWVFFRMENEHATNVHLFRASKDTPLPYPVTVRRKKVYRERSVPMPEESTPLLDEEANVGMNSSESIDSIEGYSPTIDHHEHSYLTKLSRILTTAHIKDFQRRKPQEEEVETDSDKDEDDD